MAGIELHQLRKHYLVDGKRVEVLNGINLNIPAGEITVLLGRSGCGKTTLLRLTGGLEVPDSGSIHVEGRSKTAFVFQEPRLMPWLTVSRNICFGLDRSDQDPSRLEQIIDTVGLTGFEQAHPHQLSGGMQQRCAIGRALICQPSFLLMDEPFAALDHFTRELLQLELLRLQLDRGISILFVTHSIDEALLLGHRLVILDQGRIRAQYSLPASLPEADRTQLKQTIIQHLHEKKGI